MPPSNQYIHSITEPWGCNVQEPTSATATHVQDVKTNADSGLSFNTLMDRAKAAPQDQHTYIESGEVRVHPSLIVDFQARVTWVLGGGFCGVRVTREALLSCGVARRRCLLADLGVGGACGMCCMCWSGPVILM